MRNAVSRYYEAAGEDLDLLVQDSKDRGRQSVSSFEWLVADTTNVCNSIATKNCKYFGLKNSSFLLILKCSAENIKTNILDRVIVCSLSDSSLLA